MGHGNQINGMKLDNDYLYTCGIDDTLRQVDVKSNSYTDLQVKLNAQPRGMDFNSNLLVTVTIKEVVKNKYCIYINWFTAIWGVVIRY